MLGEGVMRDKERGIGVGIVEETKKKRGISSRIDKEREGRGRGEREIGEEGWLWVLRVRGFGREKD